MTCVIHMGLDTCHRLPVLEQAGYSVDQCGTIPELQEVLDSEKAFEALLIPESAIPEEVFPLARARSAVPLVLFRETQRSIAESAFDLVVPILEPPQRWLADLAALIVRSRATRAHSKQAIRESAALPQ